MSQCNQFFHWKLPENSVIRFFWVLGTFIVLSFFYRPNLSPINDKISIHHLSPINDKFSSLIHTNLKKPDFFEICGITADGQAISMSRHFRKNGVFFFQTNITLKLSILVWELCFLIWKFHTAVSFQCCTKLHIWLYCYWNLNSLPHRNSANMP